MDHSDTFELLQSGTRNGEYEDKPAPGDSECLLSQSIDQYASEESIHWCHKK